MRLRLRAAAPRSAGKRRGGDAGSPVVGRADPQPLGHGRGRGSGLPSHRRGGDAGVAGTRAPGSLSRDSPVPPRRSPERANLQAAARFPGRGACRGVAGLDGGRCPPTPGPRCGRLIFSGRDLLRPPWTTNQEARGGGGYAQRAPRPVRGRGSVPAASEAGRGATMATGVGREGTRVKRFFLPISLPGPPLAAPAV